MSECEPCGFCHVLVGFELICFHFMLSMAWSSTCFWSFIFVFILPLPILLCFPPSSFLQLLIFPPIHLSHILSHPCSPHAPLMTFPCSSYHALFTPMFMPSLHPNPATSMQAPIFPYPSPCQSYPSPPFFSLRPRIHHHPHLHARESSSVAGKWATAQQAFHSSQTSSDLFLGFSAATSVRGASLQAVDGGLLAVLFDCSSSVVDGAISGDVHLPAPWLRKPCIPTVSVPPSLPLSSTSLLVEASPKEAARMERDALGCEGAFVW